MRGKLKFRRLDRHELALALVLVVVAVACVRNVVITLPYYQHVDECTLLSQALRMIDAHSLNPHEFYKPTLPTYIVSLALIVGDGIAILAGKAHSLADLGVAGHGECQPYFPVPIAVGLAKCVQVGLALGALAFAGVIARLVTGRRAALWLAPLLTASSPFVVRMASRYINVDIPGALFAFATLAWVIRTHLADARPLSPKVGARRAIEFGVLAGLTVGSKYNLVPILVPCSLWFWFNDRPNVVKRVLVLGTVAVATFLFTTPYAILSPNEFMYYIRLQQRAYGGGIGNRHDVGRGLPVLLEHVWTFRDNFGWPSLLLAAYGTVDLARKNGKLALLLFSYPLLFVAFMSAQTLYMARNTIPVQIAIGIAICLGALALFERSSALFRARLAGQPAAADGIGVALVGVLLVASTPWRAVRDVYVQDPDARVVAEQWLRTRLRGGMTLLLERGEAELDPRKFPRDVVVKTVPSPRSRPFKAWARRSPKGPGIVVARQASADAYAKALDGEVKYRNLSELALPEGKHTRDEGFALVYF